MLGLQTGIYLKMIMHNFLQKIIPLSVWMWAAVCNTEQEEQ